MSDRGSTLFRRPPSLAGLGQKPTQINTQSAKLCVLSRHRGVPFEQLGNACFESTHALIQLEREPEHLGGFAVREPTRQLLAAQHHRPSKGLEIPGLSDHGPTSIEQMFACCRDLLPHRRTAPSKMDTDKKKNVPDLHHCDARHPTARELLGPAPASRPGRRPGNTGHREPTRPPGSEDVTPCPPQCGAER